LGVVKARDLGKGDDMKLDLTARPLFSRLAHANVQGTVATPTRDLQVVEGCKQTTVTYPESDLAKVYFRFRTSAPTVLN
jgi:hypothetical protein